MPSLSIVILLCLVFVNVENRPSYYDDTENQVENDGDAEEDDEDEDEEYLKIITRTKPNITPLNLVTTTQAHRLYCFSCLYIKDRPDIGCLDPINSKVHLMQCYAPDDYCFTASVNNTKDTVQVVVRGCNSLDVCIASKDWECCHSDRCNNKLFSYPVDIKRRMGWIPKSSGGVDVKSSQVIFCLNVLFLFSIYYNKGYQIYSLN